MIVSLGLGSVEYGMLTYLCGARVPNEIRKKRPLRLVTDSREIESGDLFCALKDKRDGHRYTEEAKRRGAACVLGEFETGAALPHIIVPSVRRALGDWARGVTLGGNLLRIGITGSVGKTSAKDAISTLLSPHFKTHATVGNFNNDLGLPFTLLSAPKDAEIAVCELGVNHIGEMRELSRILRPKISLITCIGHAHIGAFGSREAIAEEKLDILSFAEDNGCLLVPESEPLLARILPRGIRRIPVMPFDAEAYASHGISAPFEDVARNFAISYAEAVGKLLSLPKDAINEGLSRIMTLSTHRHETEVGDVLLIDDGYNASPESMLGAIRYLATKSNGRQVAVLGDMLELGTESESFHRAVGRFAAMHAEKLFFFGAYAQEFAKGARAVTASENVTVLQGTKEEITEGIFASLRAGDTVLFKASRALEVEKIIALIKNRLVER